MTGQRRAALPSRFDLDHTLYVLRDNLGKADAFITAAEDLIEQPEGGDGGEDSDGNTYLSRRRSHIEHPVESAKRAVRAALAVAAELDTRRVGA